MLGRPRPADVKAARSDVARAKADLQAVQGGSPERRAQALEIAHQNVAAAQGRLDALLALPTQADLAAAVADLRRAEADYGALIRSDRTQPVTLAEIDAARAAIEAANQKLAKVRAGAASADVASAQAELTRARSELRTLEAGPGSVALDAARRAVDASRARLHQLLGSPLVTDVTAARLDLRKAVADLAVLRLRGGPASSYDIGLARLKVQAAKARVTLARFGEKQLTVRTPWTGTVTSVLTLPGAPVDAATPIATIADLDHMKVAVDLSEFDIAQVRPGQAATVSVDALGGNVSPGKVLAEALTGTDNGGVVTFPVLVGISAAKDIKPGMNVSVRIVVQSRHDVVQVPLEAVTRDDAGHAIVSVIEASGSTSTRRVSLGLSNNKDVEIVRGLAAGARVALAGG
jgi:HlyD family secretion protein